MNNIPQIIVNSGFEVDQNGALTEIVVPKVVATLKAPRKVTYLGNTLNWIPSNSATLQQFEAPNIQEFNNQSDQGGMFKSWTALQEVTMTNVRSMTNTGGGGGPFYGCSALQTVNMPNLLTIQNQKYGGQFASCTSLQNINMPNLISISHQGNNSSGGPFMGCTALTTVNFPKLQSTTTANYEGGIFYNCTGLVDVTLGSADNPVSQLGIYTFKGCTQSGLTITVYTSDGNAISGSPWGATNATIIWEEA